MELQRWNLDQWVKLLESRFCINRRTKNELSTTEQADLEQGEPPVPRSIQAEAGSPLPEALEQIRKGGSTLKIPHTFNHPSCELSGTYWATVVTLPVLAILILGDNTLSLLRNRGWQVEPYLPRHQVNDQLVRWV